MKSPTSITVMFFGTSYLAAHWARAWAWRRWQFLAQGRLRQRALPLHLQFPKLSASLGAIGGFLSEVLTKYGVSKEDANYYGGGLKNGAVLLQWRTPDQTRKRATTACPNDE